MKNLFVVLFLMLSACQASRSAHTSVAFADDGQAKDRGQKVSPAPSLGGGQLFDAHILGEMTQPVYPARALRSKVGTVVIPIRIVVGVDGSVTSIARRPGPFSFSIPFYQDFEAAVREVVSRWRFAPARIIYSDFDDNTGLGSSSEKFIEMGFDLDFTFQQSGKASVSPSRVAR